MTKHQLPRETDFIVYGDPDEESACRNLLGKTVMEVQCLLEQDFLRYQEDFMFMGPVAFCYYIDALINYVKASHDLDTANIFHLICNYRLEDKLAIEMRPCAMKIADCLDWLEEKVESRGPDICSEARRTSEKYRKLALFQD